MAFLPGVAFTQTVSHSDVFFTFGETHIEIMPQNDSLVIPQVMPDSGFFAQANTNPGFFSERDLGGGTTPNDIVGYNVLDDLVFWSEGDFATPRSDTNIRILNNPQSVEDTLVGTETGEQRFSFDPLANTIGQSSGSGDFHAHVDFRLDPRSSDPEEQPLFGVYGMKLSLSTDNPNIAESDPFFIVFQFGIEDDQFAEAIDDFDGLLSLSDRLPGDFDMDELLSNNDIDLLGAEVRAGTNETSFDLNNDMLVDDVDRTIWVEELVGTTFGDADLNGTVEFPDFLALSRAFGGEGGWADGDFDGSGDVQFPDFLTLSRNFGVSNVAIASVPEPATTLPMLCMIVIFGASCRRKTSK